MNAERSTTRVVVVDDDPHIVLGLETALAADGYDVRVAVDGREALAVVASFEPHALVLDLGLPALDGLGVCRTLRGLGDRIPILVLTARDEPRDRVAGLDAGADDYLGKPFDLDELLARVRALVRRAAPPAETGAVVQGIRLDAVERVAVAPGGRVELTRIEAAILTSFFDAPHRICSRDQLLDAIWGPAEAPRSNALEVYVAGLRRKLEVVGVDDLIRTVRGLGYRLNV